MSYKTSEAHRRASKKYRQENKETERINKHSDIFDLFQLQELLNKRFLTLLDDENLKDKDDLLKEYLSRQKEGLKKEDKEGD